MIDVELKNNKPPTPATAKAACPFRVNGVMGKIVIVPGERV